MIYPLILAACAAFAGAVDDVAELIDTMDSLLQPVADFRCIYEGQIRHPAKKNSGKLKLGPDGLYDTFSGSFLWDAGGDTRFDVYHRYGIDQSIVKESLALRMRDRKVERLRKFAEDQKGSLSVMRPDMDSPGKQGDLGFIFLLDDVKRCVTRGILVGAVTDDVLDGRRVKKLSFKIKGVSGEPIRIYWIDLSRSGQVVRKEMHTLKGETTSRIDVKLSPFKVGEAEVWMPTLGEYKGYGTVGKDKKPLLSKEPTVIETMYVVRGTLEFNTGATASEFTVSVKPGTKVTERLTQLEYEFGTQKLPSGPSRADEERSMLDQLAAAERQRALLVAVPAPSGPSWPIYATWLSGIAAVVSLAAIARKRVRM